MDSHPGSSTNQLNRLRAAVLGANDGIVSTAGLVLGVAGAAASKESIIIAGLAGVVAGALSMAAGEFVSVSSQRDSEKAFIAKNQQHIATTHENSMSHELTQLYIEKGFSESTAAAAVRDLQAAGSITLELERELGIDPDDLTNPWQAAIASAVSFVAGAAIPMAAIIFSPEVYQTLFTVIAVLFSLVLTGTLSARAGQANKTRAALRVVIWGIGAMLITYAIGHLIGTNIG